MSQRALAKRINANQKTVNFWERGESEPSAGYLIALADLFECTTDYILGREDDTGAVNVMRELSEGEKELLGIYEHMTGVERIEWKHYAEFLIGKRK